MGMGVCPNYGLEGMLDNAAVLGNEEINKQNYSGRLSTSYLFIKLLTDAFGPAEVQLVFLARPVYVGHLDDHVGDHQAVRFRQPVNTPSFHVIHLQEFI